MNNDLGTDYTLRKWLRFNRSIPKEALIKIIIPSLLWALLFVATSFLIPKEIRPNLLGEGCRGFVIGLLIIIFTRKNNKGEPMEAIVTTPVDKVKAQSTQAHP